MNKLLIIVIFSFVQFLVSVNSREECHHRDYGNGGTVCVCNITHCDDFDPILRTANGVIKLFETSKTGERFKQTIFNFGFNETISDNTTKTQTVTINRRKTFQKIIGFGGSFTDTSGMLIASLPISMQIRLIKDYYSSSGIEYTMGRIPIAGTDFSTHQYSYDDYPNDNNLSHFSVAREDLLYKIPYILSAEQVSAHKPKWIASAWSSPKWLKTTQSFDNGGVLIGEPGGKYYQIYANYLVKFLDAYKSHSINMWGMTTTNEPDNGFKHLGKGRFNDLGFTPTMQRDFIKLNLGPALNKSGFGVNNLKLIMFDGEKRSQVFNWTNTVLSDTEAAQYVSGVGFHWYNNTPQNIIELDKINEKYPKVFLISTEACDGWQSVPHVSLGNWTRLESYAYDIITDLNHFTSSWVDWNMVLDMQSIIDAAIIVNAENYEYYKQPFFYGLGHFIKFLAPDSVRIELTRSSEIDNFETTVFVRPDNATVLVALNMNKEAILLAVNDAINGNFSKLVQPNSIQSYIWFN